MFIEENKLENVVCEMASILSRLQYVNGNSLCCPMLDKRTDGATG